MAIPKSKNISTAASKILKLSTEQVTQCEMRQYQNYYRKILLGYGESDFKIYSTIKCQEYQPFIDWLPWLNNNKNKILPHIVSNILKRDMFAFCVFEALEQTNNSKDLFLTYTEIQNIAELYSLYEKIGWGTTVAGAYVNAVHWLMSEEAATIANEIEQRNHSSYASKNLCAANILLGINNRHIDCSFMLEVANEIEKGDSPYHAIENLCKANSLLGVTNNHVDCSFMSYNED